NAHYLAYCDDAVEHWMRDRGIAFSMGEWDFMLKKATLEWSSAARYGDILAIGVRVGRWGNTSFTVVLDGATNERAVFRSEIVFFGVGKATTETIPVPALVRERLGEAVA